MGTATLTGGATVSLKSLSPLLFLLLPLGAAAEQALEPDHRQRLHDLLVQDCGSCHGLRMTGGLGPSLTPEALAGKDRQGLEATVLQGRPGTAMPAWRDLLDEREVAWMIDQLLQGVEP